MRIYTCFFRNQFRLCHVLIKQLLLQRKHRPLLPRMGRLFLPRRSSPAPWAASDSVLPRAGREMLPLVASTCRVYIVAWDYNVFSRVFSARFVLIVVLPLCRALDSVTLLSLLPSWLSPFFPSAFRDFGKRGSTSKKKQRN
jgi:hypothetical protein